MQLRLCGVENKKVNFFVGVIRTLTPLDRESVPHYWLTIAAEDHGLVPRYTTVQVCN